MAWHYMLSAGSAPWRQGAAVQVVNFSLVRLFWSVPTSNLNSSLRQCGHLRPWPELGFQELDWRNRARDEHGVGMPTGWTKRAATRVRFGIRKQRGWEERCKRDRRQRSRQREHLKLGGWRKGRAWNIPMPWVRLGAGRSRICGAGHLCNQLPSSTNKLKIMCIKLDTEERQTR